MLTADTNDQDAVDAAIKQTEVVVACAGPFAKIGEVHSHSLQRQSPVLRSSFCQARMLPCSARLTAFHFGMCKNLLPIQLLAMLCGPGPHYAFT